MKTCISNFIPFHSSLSFSFSKFQIAETKEIHVIAFTFLKNLSICLVRLIWMKIGTHWDLSDKNILFPIYFIHSFILKVRFALTISTSHTHISTSLCFIAVTVATIWVKLLFSFHCVSTHGKKNGFLTTIINVILKTFAVKILCVLLSSYKLALALALKYVIWHHHLTLLFLNKFFSVRASSSVSSNKKKIQQCYWWH